MGGFGLVVPAIQADLGLTYAQAGSLAGAATLVYALMQVPSGMFADRFGPRRLYAVGTLGTNLLALLFALSGGYLMAVLVQAAAGATRALAFAPGMVLLSTWFPDRRATAMGMFVAGGTTWTLMFGLVAPTLLVATDWRTVVGAFASIGIVASLAFLRSGREGPGAAQAGPAASVGLTALLRRPLMWLVAAVQAVRLGVVQGVALWLPTFLIEEHGLSLVLAGGVVAAMAVATAPANLAGGYIADRLGRPLLVVGGSLAILAVALAVLAVAPGVAGIGVGVALVAVFQQLYFGPLFAVPVAVIGPSSAGVVSGFGNLSANLGGFLAVVGLGAIRDATGSLTTGFAVLAGACAVAVLVTVPLARVVERAGVPGPAIPEPAGRDRARPTSHS